jgi:hypothetical protein
MEQEFHYNISETYKRDKLEPLEKSLINPPLAIRGGQFEFYAHRATFYPYNAEGIRDYRWGCAWRSIQTCLSSYQPAPSFEELFHHFGPLSTLKSLYKDKYGVEAPLSKTFAPYELSNGWAEPFIGHLILHFYHIDSDLEFVNALPSAATSPPEVFRNKPLAFNNFKARLEEHFKGENPAPVMIDDGKSTFTIIGFKAPQVLWIADPHLQEGVNSTSGLYTVTLDETGKQLGHSVTPDAKSNLISSNTVQGLHFDNKPWMVLFPLKQK